MRQTIHIFAKDARHWRWPLVLSMALMAARTAVAPRYTTMYRGWGWNTTLDTMHLVLPLVWWFLISAAIHDDSLEGDRQFWVTRPFSWRSLLGAKALFVVAFLLAPLLVSDVVILIADGFSPPKLTPELLWSECLKLMILLPAMLLASVTRGLRQFLLGCLAVAVVFYILLSAAASGRLIQEDATWRTVVFFIPPIALVTWQFAQRRTWWVRAITAAGFVWLMLPPAWLGGSEAAAIRETGTLPRPEVGIRYAVRDRLQSGGEYASRDAVQVDLPVELTGLDRDLLNGVLVDLSVQCGASTWRASRNLNTNLVTRQGSDWLEIYIPERDAARLSANAATVRAEFAITVYEHQSTITLPRGGPWTWVAGFGYLRAEGEERPFVIRRTALFDHEQRLTYTTRLKGSGLMLRGESSGVYPGKLAMMHMTPAITYAAALDASSWTQIPKRDQPPAWDEVTVKIERPIALIKRSLTIEGVRLSDWVIQR